jgi:tRNA threonylcarbamoyladenosine biosynthesis protein TsaB
MLIFALDATTPLASVALCRDAACLHEITRPAREGHGGGLMPLIAEVMAAASLQPQALEAIAVTRGPGAFTGIRVGLATVKGLAVARDIPVIGVSSLAALSVHGQTSPALVVPILDARRDEVYAAAYRWSDGVAETVIADHVVAPQDFAESLARRAEPILGCGDGWTRYGDILRAACGAQRVTLDPAHCEPAARHVAALASARLACGERDALADLVPHYLRPSYVERKKAASA